MQMEMYCIQQGGKWEIKGESYGEGLLEHFLRARAVVPMQLFTIFTADDRAIEHVRRDRRRIEGIVKRIGGHVEWGLRLTWDWFTSSSS